MSMQQKATVLFVDDEARILRTLALAFGARYRVLTANSGGEAIELLQQHTVQVVVSDQRMPQMTGVEVLRQARDMQPSAMRILLTGYAELTSIVGSINDGEIFRYVQKPWQLDALRDTIAEAVEIARQSEQPAPDPLPEIAKQAGGILVLDRTADLFELIQASEPERPVYTAGTLDEALAHMATHPPALLVTDLQLPEGDISDA